MEHGADVNLFWAKQDDIVSLVIVSPLIEHGAAVDHENKIKIKDLMQAAGENKTSTVSILLNNGATFDKQHKEGETALLWSIFN